MRNIIANQNSNQNCWDNSFGFERSNLVSYSYAISVGLVASTLIALLVIPCLYLLLNP